MGLILRSSSLANSGNTVSVKGSALSYVEADGNFAYLLTNMSGSIISLTGSVRVNGSITGSFSGSLANFSGTTSHIPYFVNPQLLDDSAMFQVDNGGGSYSIALNQNGVSGVAPEALFVYQLSNSSYNVISGKGNLNNYLQLNIQNENNGANASSDIVATANNGNESHNYIDMGINGASFGGTIGLANDAYVYATGSNFHIGNINPSTYLGLFTGGSDVAVNNKLALYPTNRHIMSGSLTISGSLVVQSISGSVTGSVTGSLFGTSSFATVAQTASSADNFNVRNTLTATTIVVQTITSSVDFVTGSTRFGSNITNNTHTFTGSLLLTGSLIATGSVGITGSTIISGLFTVSPDNLTELQVASTGVKIGNVITDTHTITGSLNISGSTHTTIGTLQLTGSLNASGSTHTISGILQQTGSQALSGSLVIDSGSIRVASGSIFTPKVLGNTATPVMAAGTGAGSGPTISISGSDVAGYIRVLTGTGPASKNDIITVTFASAYSGLPYVLVTPASYSSSLATGGVSGTFTTASTTGFTMFSGDGALRGATAYTWSYHVFG